ncbi:hypothetical protein [Rossellomorea marisflavi]|uniref:hypothetical protein n=1 Tax=Rossellomorea marisflavi TaxID=189381 RepID=UPI00345CA0C9
MTVTAKYDIQINDIYYIPEGTEMMATGDQDGFIVVVYKGQKLYLNELYLDVVRVGIF